MSFRSLEYAVIEAFVGIRRNGLMSIATVGTTALSFGILGGFVCLAMGVNDVGEAILKDFQIGVFLAGDTTEAQRDEIYARIRNLRHVQSVKLVSKEAAWEKMRAEVGREVDLSGVQRNPLPDQLCVKLDHPRYTNAVARTLDGMPYVEEVVVAHQVVEHVVAFADLVRWIGMVAAAGLFMATAFIISNTIRLTVCARRREIRIMQLVGAGNWFIRMPLVIEGVVLGAVGGGAAYLILATTSYYVVQAVVDRMPLLGRFSCHLEPLQLALGLIGLGCLVGATGSLISIRRFLKA